jgi:hypothetical protein
MELRKLPIGIQDFERLRVNGFVYVDKTSYVYKLAQGVTVSDTFAMRMRKNGVRHLKGDSPNSKQGVPSTGSGTAFRQTVGAPTWRKVSDTGSVYDKACWQLTTRLVGYGKQGLLARANKACWLEQIRLVG